MKHSRRGWLVMGLLWSAMLTGRSLQAEPALSGPVAADVARGLIALAADRPLAALTHFDRALQQQPELTAALHGKGAALARLKRWPQAQAIMEPALQRNPAAISLRLDLAVVYLAQGNAFWALRVLSDGPQPTLEADRIRRDTLLTLALTASGQADQAPTPNPDLSQDPELRAWQRLARGQVQLARGELHAARETFHEAAQEAVSPALQATGMGLFDAALRLDSPWRTWYAGTLTTGLEYDSNALYDPDAPVIATDGSAAAGRALLRAALSLRPLRTGRHLISADFAFFKSFHFGNDEARQFDVTELAAAAGYQWRTMSGSLDHIIGLQYQGLVDIFAGGSLLPRPDTFIFLENHGGSLQYTLGPVAWAATTLGYAFQWRGFAQGGRNAWSHRATLSQTLLFWQGRVRLTVDLGARFDQARAVRYDLWAWLSGLRASLRWFWQLDVFGEVTYNRFSYHHSAGRFESRLPNTERVDEVASGSLGLGRAFFDNHLSLTLQYRFEHHGSTIAAFDYQRHVTTLLVGGQL